MNQKIQIQLPNNISLHIKREDLLHPQISGNKFRKLKYNLEEFKFSNESQLLTFGGAFSNHILATAAAGNKYGFQTIGVIRGDELVNAYLDNPTLKKAADLGMKFKFISRDLYSNKEHINFINELKKEFGSFYLLPEGGTNDLAIKGCEEILDTEDSQFTHICCSVGTGGTIAGIINSSTDMQKIIGFSSLKGSFLSNDIRKFVSKSNWEIFNNYHFGGYGKTSDELISFLNDFYVKHEVPLDPIYTGKMMFGVLDLIQQNYFPSGANILVIHTGGLQGIAGMNIILKKKNKTLIHY